MMKMLPARPGEQTAMRAGMLGIFLLAGTWIVVQGQSPESPRERARNILHEGLVARAAVGKNWKVRVAALDAIALREDASLIPRIVLAMDDRNDIVRFMAAACVAHLSSLPQKPNGASASKP